MSRKNQLNKKRNSLINKSEIARKLGLSVSYVHQLLDNGNKRKNPDRLNQIRELLNNEIKAA